MAEMATCTVCGKEFESAGSVAEVISQAQGAPPEQLENVRKHHARFNETHGGARGVCSAACAWRAFVNLLKPEN